jgi:hypothetical protein
MIFKAKIIKANFIKGKWLMVKKMDGESSIFRMMHTMKVNLKMIK